MLTVPEAASRVDRTEETVRRWIRSGRLRARKVGTQHVIEESDLERVSQAPARIEIPEAWRSDARGRPQLDWETIVRGNRNRH